MKKTTMKPDLIGLEISDKEIKELIGLDSLGRMAYSDFARTIIRPSLFTQEGIEALINVTRYQMAFWYGFIISIIIIIIGSIIGREVVDIFAVMVGTMVCGGYWLIVWLIFLALKKGTFRDVIKSRIMRKLNKLQSTYLGILLDEVDKYNKIVKELINRIDTIDQLANVGHAVSVKDRTKIISAFKNMQTELVRALKTERILREKNLKPEDFSIDFMPFKALELEGQVKDIQRLVNEATEIGLRVQEEMRKLERQYSDE